MDNTIGFTDKQLEFIGNIAYWHRDEIRELYNDKGFRAVVEYLETLPTYRVFVLGETLDDITNGWHSKFWDYYK